MFIFTICQRGAEDALKAEVTRLHPEMHLAYSRPGFITFKTALDLEPDFKLDSIFAREFGICLGKGKTHAEAAALIGTQTVKTFHCFDVDDFFPGNEPDGYQFNQRSLPNSAHILKNGDFVADIISVSETEYWAGLHRHHAGHTGWPGGRPQIEMPKNSPSRAYLKFEEARLWTGADLKAGQTAMEIGASPGGTALRLLELGLNYTAVDPKPLDPALRERFPSSFQHITKALEYVKAEEFPTAIDWLCVDANISPEELLPQLRPVLKRYGPGLKGLFLTLKLNEWALASKAGDFLQQIRQMTGPHLKTVRARQLCYNRQEFFCYAHP